MMISNNTFGLHDLYKNMSALWRLYESCTADILGSGHWKI